MKALNENKTKVAKMAMAILFAVSLISLSGCGSDKNSGPVGVGPGIGGTATCPNCPAELPYIGAALGNAVDGTGVQVALEFFTDNMAYGGGGFSGVGQFGHGVFAKGSMFVSQGLPCGILPGRYNVTNVIQPGVLNNIDVLSGLVMEFTNSNGPGQLLVRIPFATIMSATPKLAACDGQATPYDELNAAVTIEEVRVDGRYGGYCGLAFNVLKNGAPACY